MPVLQPESMIFIALLLIIVMFILIELNQETRLQEVGRRMIQFHDGIELENEVMRWLLAHPKESISVKDLGKELGRPADHVRSALERLGVPENSSKAKHEVIKMQTEKEKNIDDSGSNSSGQEEMVSCGPVQVNPQVSWKGEF